MAESARQLIVRTFAGLVMAGVLAGSVLLMVTRFVVTRSTLPAVVASVASYALVGFALAALIGLLLLVRRRGRLAVVGTVLALVGLAANGWWVAPQLVADPVPRGTGVRTVRVLTANLQFGQGDPKVLAREVRRQRVDVLVLHEETPPGWLRLQSTGLLEELPEVAGTPRYGASGSMVVSRWPLSRVSALPLTNGGLEATVGGPHPFRLLAVHPSQPFQDPVAWSRDLALVGERARVATAAGPTVLAGDFNATASHRQLRRALGKRLIDAVDAAGSGWRPTWPTADSALISWSGPVIALDHVVVRRDIGVTRTARVSLPGSDHRGVLAVLRLRSTENAP